MIGFTIQCFGILSDDLEERDSRLYLVNMVGNILKKGTYLLGIEMPNKM